MKEVTVPAEALIRLMDDLLSMRVKAIDTPCSSDQHWCTAIVSLSNMIPEYQPTDPEHLYELKAALFNEYVLHGRLSADEATKQLEQYET